MGLDMFAYAIDESGKRTDIAYWRKFNHLHGWMERLYKSRGGLEEFNCIEVELGEEDLKQLKNAVKNPVMHLPSTMGFFFGSDELREEDIKITKQFIRHAKAFIKSGSRVFYNSWW